MVVKMTRLVKVKLVLLMGDEERQHCRAALAKKRPQTPPHLCAKKNIGHHTAASVPLLLLCSRRSIRPGNCSARDMEKATKAQLIFTF